MSAHEVGSTKKRNEVACWRLQSGELFC